MTGLPDFNYPAFHQRAQELREAGHEVLNPAENPDPPGKRWEDYMRLAIGQLIQCDAIHALEGWQQSRGARIEMELAQHLGMQRLP